MRLSRFEVLKVPSSRIRFFSVTLQDAAYNVFSDVLSVDLDDALVLLGDHQARGVRGREHVDEELVGQHVQLLDILSLDVGVAGGAEQVRNPGSPYSRTDGFYGGLYTNQQLRKITNLQNIFCENAQS